MNEDQTAREIHRVMRLERMMTDAYDIALRKMNDPRLVEVLAPFREHHMRNAESLQSMFPDMQGRADNDEPFARYVEEVLESLDEAVRRDEALGELRIAEAALNMEYARALEAQTDESHVRALKECMRAEPQHIGVLSMAHETSRS